MHEIFISYAHLDNSGSDDVTHRFTDAIDHFCELYRNYRVTRGEPVRTGELFKDGDSLEPGDKIDATATEAAASCRILLAFFSPNYFQSDSCREEWRAFKTRLTQEEQSRADRGTGAGRPYPPKRLIPIEVIPLEGFALTDEEGEGWQRHVTGNLASITSEILLDRDTARLYKEIEALDRTIQEDLKIARTQSADWSDNIVIIKTLLAVETLSDSDLAEELLALKPKYTQLPPVSVIYAGGTVGMVQREGSVEPHADYEMAPTAEIIAYHLRPKLARLQFDIHFYSLAETIDSSNITAKRWVDLAKIVDSQMDRYQGIVILHGTNTLAYTASALSFLLRDRITSPVVLTGAEIPLSVSTTDAVHNVEHAVRVAAHKAYNSPGLVPEVCVYWGNYLYRGNRVTKKNASHRADSFHAPNMPVALGTLANDRVELDYEHVRRIVTDDAATRNSEEIADISVPRVDVIFIHPDMDFANIAKGFPHGSLDGLILLSYGPGNAPEDKTFLELVSRLLGEGVTVVNITQCPFGRVEFKLFETAATLFDLGVVDGHDMTLEAAYTKLLWAIAQSGNRLQPGRREKIRREIQRSRAGEMSASISTVPFGASDTFHTDGRYLVSDIPRTQLKVDRHDITEVFLRMEKVKVRAGTDAAAVRILFGRPLSVNHAGPEANLLAEFTKVLTADERKLGEFSKNVNITHPFRKCFRNEIFDMSVSLDNAAPAEFSSMSVVIYATADWGADE